MANKSNDEVKRNQVAAKFVAILKEWLTPEQFALAQRLNKIEGNLNVCHMHDFTDANMALLEAFQTFGYGKDEAMVDEALWNDVYDRAMPALGGKRRWAATTKRSSKARAK